MNMTKAWYNHECTESGADTGFQTRGGGGVVNNKTSGGGGGGADCVRAKHKVFGQKRGL